MDVAIESVTLNNLMIRGCEENVGFQKTTTDGLMMIMKITFIFCGKTNECKLMDLMVLLQPWDEISLVKFTPKLGW